MEGLGRKPLVLLHSRHVQRSRLEAMNKEFTTQLIVSEKVAARAGMDLSAQRSESVTVRGRVEPLKVYILEDAADIKELLET